MALKICAVLFRSVSTTDVGDCAIWIDRAVFQVSKPKGGQWVKREKNVNLKRCIFKDLNTTKLYKPIKFKKLTLNSGLQTYQILSNNMIRYWFLCHSYFITTVLNSKWITLPKKVDDPVHIVQRSQKFKLYFHCMDRKGNLNCHCQLLRMI